ncbi:MAG: lipopolysaccharide kinase InaA family protein [Planctomycetota bacterium]
MAGFGSFVETRERQKVGWVREDLADLDLDVFWERLEPMPGAKGRGGIGRLDVGDRQLVVRPYRRGGALGSLLADRYPKPARARDELEVLHRLQQEGVPVVAPVAAVARRHGAFWRLRLCTEWLPEARTVPQFLAEFPERRRAAAEAVGTVVQLAFAAGLRHPDLHFDNVLCWPSGDKVRAVLVDLDRARIEVPVGDRARDDMLARMQRYVVKHRSRLAAVPSRAETMRFLRGLGLDRAARHACWRSLHARVERAMRRRRWLGK